MKNAEQKFQKVMHEFGQGKLKSHGEKVTDQKQAVAIAFSEARKVNPDYGMKNEGGVAGKAFAFKQGDNVRVANIITSLNPEKKGMAGVIIHAVGRRAYVVKFVDDTASTFTSAELELMPADIMKKAGAVKGIAVKGLFSIDSIEDKTFKGYTFGDDWNGWAVPYFETEEATAIAHELHGKKGYDKPVYFMFPEEGPGSSLTDGPYKQEKIQTVDGEKTVYPIGAYVWTWSNDLLRDGGAVDERLDSLFKSLQAKDYFGYQAELPAQIQQWKYAVEKAEPNALKYTEQDIINHNAIREKKGFDWLVDKTRQMIADKNAKELTERIRYDQKAMIAIYEALTGQSLKGMNNKQLAEYFQKQYNMEYKNNGGITGDRAAQLSKIYATGTAAELWNFWNKNVERKHFLIDHLDLFRELMGENYNESIAKFSKHEFSELPKPIAREVIIHHAMGMYSNGGGIPNNYAGKTDKQIWNEWTKKQRTQFIEDHFKGHKYFNAVMQYVRFNYEDMVDTPAQFALKQELYNHVAKGQYSFGGSMPDGGGVEDALKNLIGQLDDIGIDLEDEDEEALASLRANLHDAKTNAVAETFISDFEKGGLNSISDAQGKKEIKKAIANYRGASMYGSGGVEKWIVFYSSKDTGGMREKHFTDKSEANIFAKSVNSEAIKMAKGGAIDEDVFYSEYKPQINHIVRAKTPKSVANEDIASFAGTMYETYGPEEAYIKKMAQDEKTKKRVWTIIEGDDGDMHIIAGWHFVNRQGYIITAKEWKTGQEEVKNEFSKGGPMKDGGGVGGRGFFGLRKGEKIKSANDISIGDIILTHSDQFNADNTIKVTDKRKYGTLVQVEGVYWNPKTNKRIGDEDLGIDPELGLNEYYRPKSEARNLSPSKQKLQGRINTLKATKANAGEAAQKSIQKKIDVLQKQLDYNPTAKERAIANKGKFAMDVPSAYSKSIYKKLWSMKVFPRIHKLNGTHSIVVNSQINLDKAYRVYSDMLKEKDEKVPDLTKISRKL